MTVEDLEEQIEDESQNALQLVKLIMQLAMLQERVGPLVPAASKKLVTDLLESGITTKRIGKVVGRSPGYVQGIANGKNSLGPAMFTKLVRHAINSRPNNAGQ